MYPLSPPPRSSVDARRESTKPHAADAFDTSQSARFRDTRRSFWDQIARTRRPHAASRLYRDRLARVFGRTLVSGARLLEIGCGDGALLARLRTDFTVGVDSSLAMAVLAKKRAGELHIVVADGHQLPFETTFDVIIASDLLNDVWDVQGVLGEARRIAGTATRLLVNSYSRLWELPLALARRLGLADPVLTQNWLAPQDLVGLLDLAGFETITRRHEVLCPVPFPALASLANNLLVHLWPLSHLGLTNVFVARPRSPDAGPALSVSVIVPARNEAGNIEAVFQRIPTMGSGTELVLVEGHSADDTWEAIQRCRAAHPERPSIALRQAGVGKRDAVALGFRHASGEVVMILDADVTVQPEDLPRFYEVIRRGQADLANGVRLVYPMQDRAMRFLNSLGNKFFSLAFSWLLEQPVKDTLCGTKALRRSLLPVIADDRLAELDPFGDFELLLGAAQRGLKIVDVPIRYGERTYGATNISRFRHGLLLLRMLFVTARRVRFS